MSGYSEMIGLYPPSISKSPELTIGEHKSINTGRGLPPMKIRDASVINQDLGFLALPEGFVSVPVTNYIGTEIEDSMNGC